MVLNGCSYSKFLGCLCLFRPTIEKRGMHSLPSRHESPTMKLSASQESSSTRTEIIPPTPVQLGVVEPVEAFAANEAGLGGIKCLIWKISEKTKLESRDFSSWHTFFFCEISTSLWYRSWNDLLLDRD